MLTIGPSGITMVSDLNDAQIDALAARAAYVIGEYHRKAGKRMGQYIVARWQEFYEAGYQGLTDDDSRGSGR